MAVKYIEMTPRAWVGCLGCYNSGRLNGKWIEAIEATDTESAGLTDSAGNCLLCNADEFYVLDHENFGGLLKGECSPQEAQEIAEKLDAIPESEREAFFEYAENIGESAEYDDFSDAYCGQYDNQEAFAEELLESTGDLDSDSFLARYFDMEAFARDLFYDYFITENGHVFRNC